MSEPSYLQAINASASPERQMNENFLSLEASVVFAQRPQAHSGLTWGYYGGPWGGGIIANGTVSLTGAAGSPTPLNYIVVHRGTRAVSVSSTTTNWNNVAQYARIGIVGANASAVEFYVDCRFDKHGALTAQEPMLWNQQTDNYTLALTDAEGAVAMNKATANTLTIPADATVDFPSGTSIIIYQEGAGKTTVAAAGGVTLRTYASGSPMENALAGQYAMATVVKRSANEWVLSGAVI